MLSGWPADVQQHLHLFMRPDAKWSLAETSRGNERPPESACGLVLCVEPPSGRVGVCFYTSVKEETDRFPIKRNQTLFEERDAGDRTLGVRCGPLAKLQSCKPEVGASRIVTPTKMLKGMIRVLVRAAREYNVGLNYHDRTVAWGSGEVPSNAEWTSARAPARYPIDPSLRKKGILGICLEDSEAGREAFTFRVFRTDDQLLLRWDKKYRNERSTTLCTRRKNNGDEAPCAIDAFAETLQAIVDLDAPLRGAIMQSGEEEYALPEEHERSVRRRLEQGSYVHAVPSQAEGGTSVYSTEANFYPATFSFSVDPHFNVEVVGSCESRKRKAASSPAHQRNVGQSPPTATGARSARLRLVGKQRLSS